MTYWRRMLKIGPAGVLLICPGLAAARSAWGTGSPAAPAAVSEYYVAPIGSDSNPGSREQPFATLEGARTAVRALKQSTGLPASGMTVWLRGGFYPRTSTFTLSTEDSGSPEQPVTYRGYPGERARLVGGRLLEPAWFTTVTSASPVWMRVDPAARGRLVQADLAAHGITDYGKLAVRGFGSGSGAAMELFFNQAPMTLARWPDAEETDKAAGLNHGFASIAKALSDTQFTYAGTRPERWLKAPEIWFHGYWYYPWADLHVAGTGIDTGARTVTLAQKPGYGIQAGQSYYAENLLEELTTPGEWYLERGSGMLYFWPPAELSGSEIVVSTLSSTLVRLTNASYIALSDLILEVGRADLLRIEGGAHNSVSGCILRNAGTTGAVVSGTDNGLNRCQILATGDAGVSLSGGKRADLAPGNNYVRNCDIHDFGRWSWTYQPAVRISGAGQSVAHNRMHDAPHAAILFSGNEHAIEYNEIYRVCRFSSDAGAIYGGRDWGYRGNRILYNFIHHIETWFQGHGVHGIYLDDCISGIRVFGNILYRISGHGVQNGGGRDNLIENNIFARNGDALTADSRGISMINNTPGNSWNLLERLAAEGIQYQKPPWSSAYPKLAAIPGSWAEISAPGSLWRYPQGCVFSRNIGFANGAWTRESNYGGSGTYNKYEEIRDNLQDQDPQFVDEAALNLALKPTSPAWAIPGFQAIPFRDIGPEGKSVELALGRGGSAAATTRGSVGALQTGYAAATVSAGSAPYGTAVFSLRQEGAVVCEAAVPAAPPTTSARLFVDYGLRVAMSPAASSGAAPVDIYTGVALVNRASGPAAVSFTLRDSQGRRLASGGGTLPAGAQRARFLHQLQELAPDFQLPAGFPQSIRYGSLQISSDQPLSIMALRMTLNQRGHALFTSLPVADLTRSPAAAPLYFPQFVDGEGYLTTLMLLNPSEQVQSGSLNFYAGSGAPLEVRPSGGSAASTFRFSIPAGGLFVFQSDGTPASAQVASVQLIPDQNSTTPAAAGLFSRTSRGYLSAESGIPAVAATSHARVAVDLSGAHDYAMALAETTGQPQVVTLQAFQSDGMTPAGGSATRWNLPGHGQKAAFAGEWMAGLPPLFRGVLDISAASPFAVLSLRTLINERQDFIIAALPSADLNREAPAPMLFPHIADGAGYRTEFLLLSAGSESRVSIQFFDADGAPLAMGISGQTPQKW